MPTLFSVFMHPQSSLCVLMMYSCNSEDRARRCPMGVEDRGHGGCSLRRVGVGLDAKPGSV